MVIAGPRPKDGVSDLGGNRVGIKVSSPLADSNIPRRPGDESRKEKTKKGEKPEMHSGSKAPLCH